MNMTSQAVRKTEMLGAGLRLLVAFVALEFGLAEFAFARNCTPAEKSAADAQLWLNERDTSASLARHLPWGQPESAADRLLIQRDYVTGYSDSLRVPLWTAHRLDASGLGKVARVDCFRADPRIPASAASFPSDYDEPIYDQGHLSPNGDMSKGLTPVLNSFVMSNMAPQHCQFNRGVWQILESLVRIWAQEHGPIYVITGSIFDRDGNGEPDDDALTMRMASRNGKSRVAVPSHFYKVLIRPLSSGGVDALAIVMPNDKTNLDGAAAARYIENHLVAVADIEKLTGVALLPQLATNMPDRASALWPHRKSAARSLARACAP